jgi:hypothetical protein
LGDGEESTLINTLAPGYIQVLSALNQKATVCLFVFLISKRVRFSTKKKKERDRQTEKQACQFDALSLY